MINISSKTIVCVAFAVGLGSEGVIAQNDLGVSLSIDDIEHMPLYLEVFINGKSTELIAEFRQDVASSAMSSPRKELIEIGIDPGPGTSQIVALDNISGLTYSYDEPRQVIMLNVDLSARQTKVISANRAQKPLTADRTYGAVLNYSARVSADNASGSGLSGNQLNLSTDAWLFSPFGVLSNSGAFTLGADGEHSLQRFSTNYEFSFRDQAVTVGVGDLVSSSFDWGRSIRIGGVQLRREFRLRNDIVTEPLLSFEGAAAVPSTIDVFIDNNRVYSGALEEGPYRLEDLPQYSGSGDALVVVRDESGEVTSREVPFFASRNLLKKGVADYSLEFGLAREGYGMADSGYGEELVFSGSIRYGLSNRWTLEAHAEGKEDLSMFSLGAATVVANRAELSFSGGQSQYDGQTARFGYAKFRTNIGAINIEGSALRAEDGFADLAQATAVDFLGKGSLGMDGSLLQSPKALDVLSVSFPLKDMSQSLGVSYVRSERMDSKDELLSVNYVRSMDWGGASINLSAAHDFENDDTRLAALVSMQLGKAHSQVSAGNSKNDGFSTSAHYFDNVGESIGDKGYSFSIEQSDRKTQIAAAMAARTRYGMAEFSTQTHGQNVAVNGRFEGSLVMAGGQWAAGNTVQDGFAIVDVGVPDLPIYLQNREVTRSGQSGKALVAGLTSFGNNRISINTDELPLDATLTATAMDLVPAHRSGVLVDLGGSESGVAGTITLRDSSGNYLPAGSVAELNGQGDAVYVGFDGIAFLTGLQDKNQIVVATSAGKCTASFAGPIGTKLQHELGEVQCE